MRIIYIGLEQYESRYTLQLTDWTKKVYEERGIEYLIIPGSTLDDSKAIVTGQVLDAHGRSYFAMSQMMYLIKLMKEGQIGSEDHIFFEDMFHPGIESIPYIIDQIDKHHRPKIWLRCLAQSIDPDDFVHFTGMTKWMRPYEEMVNEFATGILATNEEMVAHMKIAGWKAPIYNISGLAFGKKEVISRVEKITPFDEREQHIVYAARFDAEKQPHFFMDYAENMWNKFGDIKIFVLSGGELKSNDPSAISRVRDLEKYGVLYIREHLNKNEYYKILASSRLLFNCALQDWVSNTVSEADALGCNVLYPAYRSFPETFSNDMLRMYIPWSINDAIEKTKLLLSKPVNQGKISDWNDKTISRCLDIMSSVSGLSRWKRMHKNYRQYVTKRNY